jgi:septal ring factor EnvC (AmiA/AmiB activator)
MDSMQPAPSKRLVALQVAAAEAAMALRDHIIKQLVTALQQKKAEVKALREQQAALQRQLEAAEGEGVASKQKLRELAEGIQVSGSTSADPGVCCKRNRL